MVDMNGMVDRCIDAMGAMMGGGMMGSGTVLDGLLLVFLVWLIGLASVVALIFWGVKKLSEAQHHNG